MHLLLCLCSVTAVAAADASAAPAPAAADDADDTTVARCTPCCSCCHCCCCCRCALLEQCCQPLKLCCNCWLAAVVAGGAHEAGPGLRPNVVQLHVAAAVNSIEPVVAGRGGGGGEQHVQQQNCSTAHKSSTCTKQTNTHTHAATCLESWMHMSAAPSQPTRLRSLRAPFPTAPFHQPPTPEVLAARHQL